MPALPLATLTDHELLVALRSADQAALAELYTRHAARMLGVAQRLLGTRRDAEDVLHDVFLEIWQRAQDYEAARGSASTWLYLRVRSRALDRLRALGRARKLSSAEADANEARSEVPAGEEELALRRAVRDLPSELGQLVALGYEHGLSAREMSTRTQVPIGTVKSRIARALAVLRFALREDEHP